MELNGRVAVITGGSGGIGKSMAKAFLDEGAQAIVLADLHEETVLATAGELDCDAMVCDVTDETQIVRLVDETIAKYGRIDVFCSNAGAGGVGLLTDATNDVWQRQWELHVMSHLYAARSVLPGMLERGEGYLLNTASAAGLLAAMGSGPYTVTKAAAVKLAEFLSITHGDDGIRVSVLCPQGVNTAMAPRSLGDGQTDGIIEPDQLAQTVVEAIRDERFHVLPHPEVEEYVRRKGDNIDRWLFGMRRLRRQSTGEA
ncbi:MAG: SDR family oxidoreductase [Pseudomonadales bacterium]|jgi:NAD(P)-dependent dehydrogenase (short-subunit alcohol dehydrogenase family)|nr:SDR family oxidoreductase [Pseudomonadales bacterium]MDP6471265.1 SDR family oxidoreductase [Pseudomonadales bacterium]MDP6825546.1 SDR family oxidoreductase [Pseudomonadales bacterium]MDP6972913.1 SDR family oxidoreductase [Pseudomonadales bacterium]|tara:strand:- start:1005 stop:1775 length:771 start_codon:yes stop_codon:yes gene_type:complete